MPDTTSALLARLFLSSGIEGTAGNPTTLNKSIYPKVCDVNFTEVYSPVDVVSGTLNSRGLTRELIKAMGSIEDYMHPEFAGWVARMSYRGAPVSALVSPSTTVYEHVWSAVTNPPPTFTLMKTQSLAGYTERFAGNGITGFSVKSGAGRISQTIKVEGMGVYAQGIAAPGGVLPITTADEDYCLGTISNVLVDGTAYAKGTIQNDWSLDVEHGTGLEPTAGSTDFSVTRYDFQKERVIKANFTVLETGTTNLADFLAATFHTYQFQCWGPYIDQANSLRSLIEYKLLNARAVADFKSAIRDHGVYKVPISIHGITDLVTGNDLTTRVRSLQTTY